MCKIVAFSNTSKLDKRAASKIGGLINKIEKDGYGYAIQGSKGVFGEKSVFKRFHSRVGSTSLISLPIVKPQHSMFGDVGTFTGPGIFHGRTSTNDRGLLNCHPMQRDNWSLIHNGVVTDSGPKYDKFTTNDSEDVLKRLIDGIENVEKYLSGYYAFAAIDPAGRLHIGRDSIATLYMCKSPDKDTYVFATTVELLKAVLKALNMKHGPIEAVENDVYAVFDGNNLISHQTIKPLGYSSRESAYATQSLGRAISTPGIYSATGSLDEGWPLDRDESIALSGNVAQRDTRPAQYMAEDDYYMYRAEIEHMDRSYTIYTEDGAEVDLADFKRMSYREQERCQIERPDGTRLSCNDEDGELLYG